MMMTMVMMMMMMIYIELLRITIELIKEFYLPLKLFKHLWNLDKSCFKLKDVSKWEGDIVCVCEKLKSCFDFLLRDKSFKKLILQLFWVLCPFFFLPVFSCFVLFSFLFFFRGEGGGGGLVCISMPYSLEAGRFIKLKKN